MPNPKYGAKSAEKIPALIVFDRIHGSNVNQAAVFPRKDSEAAKKAALDTGCRHWKCKPRNTDEPQPLCPRASSTPRDGSRFRRPRQKSLLNSSACSKPKQAKGSFPAAAPNPRPHLVAKIPGVLEEVEAVEKAIAESSQGIEKRRKLWRGCHYRNPVLAASREHLKLDDKKLKAATLLAMRGDAKDLEMLSASPALCWKAQNVRAWKAGDVALAPRMRLARAAPQAYEFMSISFYRIYHLRLEFSAANGIIYEQSAGMESEAPRVGEVLRSVLVAGYQAN